MRLYFANRKFPLYEDVTEYLLACIPDIPTLLSLISVSKQIYAVFQARSHSITSAVAYNQLGTVLPQALTLVRCEAAGLVQCDVNKLPDEADALHHAISSQELRMLARNAKTVVEWEDLFSWRYCPQSFSTKYSRND
jgi:hypothetical protein